MNGTAPIVRDLVLLGGGHAHVQVLKSFAMKPIGGVRVTLVNRDTDTPYSGMLPGLIAGHYSFEEAHIDLGRLCRFARARFLHDEAVGIEPHANRLLFRERPPLRYDLLSIDTGSTPETVSAPGADAYTVPVKPIGNFLERWNALCARAVAADAPMRVAVAGAGAGGVELLLAAQFKLKRLREARGIDTPVRFEIFSASDELLPSFPASVQAKFQRVFDERDVVVHRGAKVARVADGALILTNGERHTADEILWVTHAGAPDWFAKGGLATDERGFIRVAPSLQSISHPDIFAAGDIASVDAYPRPKAGVFAVRQGPPLGENLRRVLLGDAPRPFIPQSEFLTLISTGDRYAVAARNGISLEGAWVWRWKDWIDRRFMARFNELPAMDSGRAPEPTATLPDSIAGAAHNRIMRCAGCGAKIGARALQSALRDLKPAARADVLAGLDSPDDAAMVRVPKSDGVSLAAVHTVDSFRALVDDPYLFGKIAANHALGDIFAMGGEPQTALAIATLPYAAPENTAADLQQMMAGAVEVFNAEGVGLIGGHSAEGAELALGFSINGVVADSRALRKGGMRAGDILILTKPLGTGVLFAADMHYCAKSLWIAQAIHSMLQSNGPAALCFLEHDAHACTDVTGFGLAGHLGEMAKSSDLTIAVDTHALPALDGVADLIAAGFTSSLQDQNIASGAINFAPAQAPVEALLYDPQTCGGLVAAVPPAMAETCLGALRAMGYSAACIVGTAEDRDPSGALLSIAKAASG